MCFSLSTSPKYPVYSSSPPLNILISADAKPRIYSVVLQSEDIVEITSFSVLPDGSVISFSGISSAEMFTGNESISPAHKAAVMRLNRFFILSPQILFLILKSCACVTESQTHKSQA